MTEKGTGENAGAVGSGHEMVVTYEPSMHGFRCEPVCHEPAGADDLRLSDWRVHFRQHQQVEKENTSG